MRAFRDMAAHKLGGRIDQLRKGRVLHTGLGKQAEDHLVIPGDRIALRIHRVFIGASLPQGLKVDARIRILEVVA